MMQENLSQKQDGKLDVPKLLRYGISFKWCPWLPWKRPTLLVEQQSDGAFTSWAEAEHLILENARLERHKIRITEMRQSAYDVATHAQMEHKRLLKICTGHENLINAYETKLKESADLCAKADTVLATQTDKLATANRSLEIANNLVVIQNSVLESNDAVLAECKTSIQDLNAKHKSSERLLKIADEKVVNQGTSLQEFRSRLDKANIEIERLANELHRCNTKGQELFTELGKANDSRISLKNENEGLKGLLDKKEEDMRS